ncbi:hypothetical protein [Vreelandella azerica]|uniref:hypothetical protein n=1 Tax=Vreelandella azerica TaxID=2732867 RepID=UPI003BF4AC6F
MTNLATTDVTYYEQENGNITNDSGQRIYQDQDDNFTTDAVTEAERSDISELDTAIAQVDSFRTEPF